MSHDWGYYPGDELVKQPPVSIDNTAIDHPPTKPLKSISQENPFDLRRQTDPQGVIDDLLKQQKKQAKIIGDLMKNVAEFEKELVKLKKIER